ncbi:MAG: helix-turn-helix transcriptional regulator [Oxalobacter sp.]|nr:helix-turn-helix transcriptional regulator [Oxalobacter sp.]
MIKQIGQRIRELRRAKGISQEQLGLEAGLHRTYIVSVENGKRNISISALNRIWEGLHITPQTFFDSSLFKKKESKA